MNASIPVGFVLERDRRLSDSMLWGLQRKFFSEQTIDAWRQGIVPHYVTSNTFIARAYARVVFGYVRDLAHSGAGGLDRSEPLYVLELGAGSGRFSYHFLKHFFALLERSSLREVAVTFVMSDFSERNLEFWRAHASLQPFVAQGRLDFALVDLSRLDSIALVESGRTLAEGALRNPLVVLANYVFDGIEQDAFYVDGGVLHESLVSIYSDRKEEDPNDAGILQRAHTGFSNRPADGDYYPEPGLNAILDDYRQRFDDTHFLMPAQALRHLDHLRRIGNGRLLMVSADKGNSREEDLRGCAAPEIVSHGSISLMVNYHAIRLHVERQGGRFFTTPQRHASLHVCAALFDDSLPGGSDTFSETSLAFAEDIGQTGPDDFFVLKRFIQGNARHLSLEQLLAYMRLSGWDAANFWGCQEAFMQHATALDGPLRTELVDMAAAVWETYYWLGEERDLAFALGGLMYELGYDREAIIYLEHSLRLYGDNAGALYNIAMCFYNQASMAEAARFIERVLRLDPDYEPARAIGLVLAASTDDVIRSAER